ncbi:chitin synthase-domain-containing protein [Gigaspora rosea]|uniref:Chitin synthase n=1 Tax=Gigaspora rosea TaxID=44941 RepID=A0A397VXR5_9GLOM|nr:chitin synthase-domain-containing protein [Gigaspora rosea]
MNILINDGRALITDFGISKQLNDTTTSSDMKGIPAYIEPQCFFQRKKPDQKSDIYSLGVLLWELSSGVRPFQYFSNAEITLLISQKKREKTFESTPPNYATLYRKCWSTDPDKRPTLNYILKKLEMLLTEPVIEFITNDINQIVTLAELYPIEDDYVYLDEYDRCIECENAINSFILSNFSLKERSFRINKLLPKNHNNGLTSIATEQHKMTKLIELVHGNLVIECPVHPNLLISGPHNDSKEFTHMRYTACTCNPDAFKQEKFTLRQTGYESTRQTELFILITVNDDEDRWKKIIICIVSDRNKINKRTLSYLNSLGVYQNDIARSKVNNETVRAHIYEYTTQISIKCSKDFVDKKTMVPTQILFCLKENNNEEIGSYQWFFDAFCPIINPKICVFIKVGVKPADKSIYYLWKAFTNDQVAGTCGKLYVMNNRGWTKLLNPFVGALIFEHNISNIMNKPFESAFGYISSLSKDFSAYRYSALQDITNDTEDASNNNILVKNDYLAKSNVLCFELISKRNFSWILHYENSSQAEVDVLRIHMK